MIDRIQHLADTYAPYIIELRRFFHQHPEPSFQEIKTSQRIREVLDERGIPYRFPVAQTGIVAAIQGKKPGPTRALRADMDALPIQEATGLPFASKVPGWMHACGHDAHTAMLLGVAMILQDIQEELHGTVRLLFQPAEEQLPGGALAMIREGALEADASLGPAPRAIFGQHVYPDIPTGYIGVRPGPYMAAIDDIHLTIEGQGGHAGRPHELGGDTVVATAHVILALQSVISRYRPPLVPAVLSFGRIEAPGATNVIPPRVKVEGSFRTLDASWRKEAHEHIREVAMHAAASQGVTCHVHIEEGYPVLYNDPELTAMVRKEAHAYVGPERVVELDPVLGSEDFACYLQHIPGVFYRLGIRNEARGIVHGLHTPRFMVDEDALPVGTGFMAYLAYRYGLRNA